MTFVSGFEKFGGFKTQLLESRIKWEQYFSFKNKAVHFYILFEENLIIPGKERGKFQIV